jgi:hypothetical protein
MGLIYERMQEFTEAEVNAGLAAVDAAKRASSDLLGRGGWPATPA